MALKEEFVRTGNLLFRWRSYLPLVFAPLLVHALSVTARRPVDETMGPHWGLFCVVVALAGLGVRALALGQAPERTSGRNTLEQVADTLNTTGMYSVVRHPLYLGNFIGWLGVAMFPQSGLLVLAAVLAFALYYERIMFAEEAFLRRRFSSAFDDWASRTPAFVPDLRLYRASSAPFSWSLVLQREYSSMFATVVTFTVLEGLREWFARGWLRLGPGWWAFLVAGTVAYAWLRAGKKASRRAARIK